MVRCAIRSAPRSHRLNRTARVLSLGLTFPVCRGIGIGDFEGTVGTVRVACDTTELPVVAREIVDVIEHDAESDWSGVGTLRVATVGIPHHVLVIE